MHFAQQREINGMSGWSMTERWMTLGFVYTWLKGRIISDKRFFWDETVPNLVAVLVWAWFDQQLNLTGSTPNEPRSYCRIFLFKRQGPEEQWASCQTFVAKRGSRFCFFIYWLCKTEWQLLYVYSPVLNSAESHMNFRPYIYFLGWLCGPFNRYHDVVRSVVVRQGSELGA